MSAQAISPEPMHADNTMTAASFARDSAKKMPMASPACLHWSCHIEGIAWGKGSYAPVWVGRSVDLPIAALAIDCTQCRGICVTLDSCIQHSTYQAKLEGCQLYLAIVGKRKGGCSASLRSVQARFLGPPSIMGGSCVKETR